MDKQATIQTFIDIVGEQHVLTGDKKTEYYRCGFRSGKGKALAILFMVHWLSSGVYYKLLSKPIASS